MKWKSRALTAILGAMLFCGLSLAQEPAVDIDAHRHANLAEAQRHIAQAFHYVNEARKDNRYDMKGHAEKALELLTQANQELKTAAQVANAAGEKRR